MASLSMELALVAVNRMINTLEGVDIELRWLFNHACDCVLNEHVVFADDTTSDQIRGLVQRLASLAHQVKPTKSTLGPTMWLTIDDYRSRFHQVSQTPTAVVKLCCDFLEQYRRLLEQLNKLRNSYEHGEEPKPYMIEVMDALYTQHPIHALRIWRFATSCNLKEAIAAVCQLAVDNPDGIPESTMTWCRSKLELKAMTEVKTIEHADVTFMN